MQRVKRLLLLRQTLLPLVPRLLLLRQTQMPPARRLLLPLFGLR
jgi:hypothetical protein